MGVIFSLTLLSLLGIVSPGPDFVAVSQMSLLNIKKNTLFFILGIAIGNGFWVCTALLGIEGLFKIYPNSFVILKILGGVYLSYLGVKTLRSVSNRSEPESFEVSPNNSFYKGLAVTLSNPKAAVFYIAILSSAIPENADNTLFILVITVTIATFIWFSFVSSILLYEKVSFAYQSKEALINKIFGGLFLTYGVAQLVSVLWW